ncbi:MAG: hypothetical protein HS116_02300 [Planctomycetes bacterium]|nr:hypothetical protein [Planctomycetota bacterium]
MTTFEAIANLHEMKVQKEKELQVLKDRVMEHCQRENFKSDQHYFDMERYYARELQKLKDQVAALNKAGQMMSKR